MLEVIGAGFGRTGTLSLKAAVERLGFGPCHHMLAMFDHPEEIPAWQQAAAGGPADWTRIYRGYRATIDWPGARFWRQLVAAYPKAKVLLSVRDEEAWYESAYETIYRSMLPPDPGTDPTFTGLRDVSDQVVWQGQFGGRFADKEHALRVYREHNAAVMAEVPADRLLVYRLGDGWGPLCEFLGVPVPGEEFPRVNDRAKFNEMIDEYTAERV